MKEIIAHYHTIQFFDIDEICDELEIDSDDIEEYSVHRGVLYLHMKDGSEMTYNDDGYVDYDFRCPDQVVLCDGDSETVIQD